MWVGVHLGVRLRRWRAWVGAGAAEPWVQKVASRLRHTRAPWTDAREATRDVQGRALCGLPELCNSRDAPVMLEGLGLMWLAYERRGVGVNRHPHPAPPPGKSTQGRTQDHSSGQPRGPRRTSVASARSSLSGSPTPSHHDLDPKRHFAPLPCAPACWGRAPCHRSKANRSPTAQHQTHQRPSVLRPG